MWRSQRSSIEARRPSVTSLKTRRAPIVVHELEDRNP
ncbi:TPA: hypothetical protein N0F65_006357 [Lagenidium giganteum]|uniref:Uncharacterized protein n=1 Tax=Lagenidium giganteum TaxID=4803 RepID=A0AAV2YXM3_9STRA|nr:TPA: hypothetical protein N0F65_006357 [Lagenidium giganteum]